MRRGLTNPRLPVRAARFRVRPPLDGPRKGDPMWLDLHEEVVELFRSHSRPEEVVQINYRPEGRTILKNAPFVRCRGKRCCNYIRRAKEGRPRLFCSGRCRRGFHKKPKPRRGKVTLICPWCGSAFVRETNAQKFCSVAHRIADQYQR